MISLVLYSTAGCHLCELAEAQLAEAGHRYPLSWQCTEIADSTTLMDKYALRIPVVAELVSGQEIGWPFGQLELGDFLSQFHSCGSNPCDSA